MRIALINAPLRSAVSDFGVGHQLPLGLLMVGGPLKDAGHDVTLIDAAADHLSDPDIVSRVQGFGTDLVMISHVGATTAHPCCLRVLRAIRLALPHVVTAYGGVHASYHSQSILAQHPEVDVVVKGEGEVTALDLVNALATRMRGEARAVGPAWASPAAANPGDAGRAIDLTGVPSVAWRQQGGIVANPGGTPIADLDAYRIGWELVGNWDRYRAFGQGRAAVVQFSRGCPHTCTFCGQWMFWKRWRHRDPIRFVDELEWLHRQHQVNFFWLADENPTTLKSVWTQVLAEISRRQLSIALCGSFRAQDIVRDADILPLYRSAGFLYILMGIETVTDDNLAKIRKNSSVDDAYQAVRLLRKHQIMSIVDYMFGIEDETPATIWRGLRGLLRYDGDFVNALYLTPHAWTPLGHALKDAPVVEPDLWRWDYRHQVMGVRHLSPGQLFVGVKLVELLYHLHPRRIWRLLTAPDRRLRRQLQWSFFHIGQVWWYEVYEHFANRVGAWWKRRRVTTQRDLAPVPAETAQRA